MVRYCKAPIEQSGIRKGNTIMKGKLFAGTHWSRASFGI